MNYLDIFSAGVTFKYSGTCPRAHYQGVNSYNARIHDVLYSNIKYDKGLVIYSSTDVLE